MRDLNTWRRALPVALILALLVVTEAGLIAQNLGSAPQTNVAVQGQTGAQPEGTWLNLINWVGNVIAPVGAGGAAQRRARFRSPAALGSSSAGHEMFLFLNTCCVVVSPRANNYSSFCNWMVWRDPTWHLSSECDVWKNWISFADKVACCTAKNGSIPSRQRELPS